VFWFRHLNPKSVTSCRLLSCLMLRLARAKGLRRVCRAALPFLSAVFLCMRQPGFSFTVLISPGYSQPSGICQGCFLVAFSMRCFLDWKITGRFGSCGRSEGSVCCWLQAAFIIGVVPVPSGTSAVCG